MQPGEYDLLARTRPGINLKPTMRTRHMVYGRDATAAVSSLLVARASDGGVLLLYLDAAGLEITDTWHETPADAFEQAKFEYGLSEADFQLIN